MWDVEFDLILSISDHCPFTLLSLHRRNSSRLDSVAVMVDTRVVPKFMFLA